MVKPLEPYKYKIKQSALSTDFEPIKSELPIVEFINNEYRTSDLSGNIRSKIDIIDIVQSGFANNIEDFSDAFWVLKTDWECQTSICKIWRLTLQGQKL
jgi:Phage portal protein, SPP1 Gp6-like.